MKSLILSAAAVLAASPLAAQETRELSAHVHGVSTLELAVEHGRVEMNLLSPGMDIVGFEYEASSEADKDAVDAAIRQLLRPEDVVTLPAAAECRLAEVLVHLHSGAHHHEGEEHMHAHEGEGHDHKAEGHDHDHKDGDHDHKEGDHDHAHEHGDHDHDEGAQHSEFHARYIFACDHEDDVTQIEFPFFGLFPNAQEIEATFVTETGAGTAEIPRDAAVLTLE